jgi:carboxymethylenebutenolidase
MTDTRAETSVDEPLSEAQQSLLRRWEEHLACEFTVKDAKAAIDTMVERPRVNHVPVLTGGVGRAQLEHFYRTHFIPQMPPDRERIPISRTIGKHRIVDEFVSRFTHTVPMDWFLPGVPPTGKRVEVAVIVVVEFDDDGKIVAERIHWDQATVLVQLGLLDPAGLPVAGVETARKVLDPDLPSNVLIERAG